MFNCTRYALLAGSAFALALTSAGPAIAVEQPAATQAAFAPSAQSLLDAAYPADGPGAAAIVMRGGKEMFVGGRGLASLDSRRAITPDTVFRLGSITKQFTAAIVLQLVAEGKLSLDDPLGKFFPDWPQPGAGATVRQLLNHSSGVQDFSKIPGWMRDNVDHPHSTAELVAVIRAHPSLSPPGTKWEYNNGGYVLLSAIIEKITGKPWHDAVAKRLSGPLGLTSIRYAVGAEKGPLVAGLHSNEKGKAVPVPRSHMSNASGAGGLVGTVRDLAKWAAALHHGKVVRADLYQEMTRPMTLADGSRQDYGFALRTEQLRGRPILKHGGSGRGFRTASTYVPEQDLFVAVFANSDEPAMAADVAVVRLAAMAMGEAYPTFAPAKVDLATIAPLFGSYKLEAGPPRLFFERDGRLYIGRGPSELEVTAAGNDRFYLDGQVNWFQVKRDPAGNHAMEMHLEELRAPQLAVRTGPVPTAFAVPAAVLNTYVGTFKTEGPLLTIAVDPRGRLMLTVPGQPPMLMRPVSDQEYMVDDMRSRVVFHPENGRVDRLVVHRGARQLPGVRQP